MISQFVRLSSGSLIAQSMLGILPPPLSLPLSCSCSLPCLFVFLKMNKHQKKLRIFFFFNFFNIYFWKRERKHKQGGAGERETESKAASMPWTISTEPDVGLELTTCEIMIWAKVRWLSDWATQVPLNTIFLRALLIQMLTKNCITSISHEDFNFLPPFLHIIEERKVHLGFPRFIMLARWFRHHWLSICSKYYHIGNYREI